MQVAACIEMGVGDGFGGFEIGLGEVTLVR